jgi:hypothetical protein
MPGTLKLRSEAVDWRQVDDEIVVLIKSSSTYVAINSAGAAIWPAIAEGATRDDLVVLLQERFGIDPGRAAKDADAFVRALAAQDLLVGTT